MFSLRKLYFVRALMVIVNFIMISFMSIMIYNTTELICENDIARSFIEQIKYMPSKPWKVPFYSILLLVLLIISVVIRERRFKDNQFAMYMFCIVDILLCIGINYRLNMSYKGVLLLAIANIVLYIEGKGRRGIFITAAVFIYALLDYNLLSIKTNIFSINDYFQYYSTTQRLYIFGFRNLLSSFNDIIFIIFMIFVIQTQIDENKKITELYSRLFKTAEELRVVNIQLEDYARKSEDMAKTKERNRLAREIHDTIGHSLTGIATGLEACLEIFEVNKEKAKVQLYKIAELARKGLVEVRRSVSELRPDALERDSLIAAIQKLSDDINECTSTRVQVEVEGDIPTLDPDEEETVYRVVQEGITNAVRHGAATEISILLSLINNILHIEIKDNGVGCAAPKSGFGLRHIKERIRMLKGNVSISGEEGIGFNIFADIPIRGKN